MQDNQHAPIVESTEDSQEAILAAEPEKVSLRKLWPAIVREALTPNKIALLVLFIAAAYVCGRLGMWQLDRAYERANLAQQHEIEEAANAEPDPLGQVLAPQETFGGSLVGKRVVVTGTYEDDKQLLVADRTVNGQEGFLIINSLRVTDDGSNGASWAELSGNPLLPVVRGWVPLEAVDANGQLAQQWANDLQPEPIETNLIGWLQASESTLYQELPAGQTNSISSAELANLWGGPIYGGYLVVQESDPVDTEAITKLPRPSIEGSEGLNTQNLFYALQWWVFGGFAVLLWLRLVIDEARRSKEEKPVNPFDILDANS